MNLVVDSMCALPSCPERLKFELERPAGASKIRKSDQQHGRLLQERLTHST
jgi:hypothetical protein